MRGHCYIGCGRKRRQRQLGTRSSPGASLGEAGLWVSFLYCGSVCSLLSLKRAISRVRFLAFDWFERQKIHSKRSFLFKSPSAVFLLPTCTCRCCWPRTSCRRGSPGGWELGAPIRACRGWSRRTVGRERCGRLWPFPAQKLAVSGRQVGGVLTDLGETALGGCQEGKPARGREPGFLLLAPSRVRSVLWDSRPS